MSVFVIYITLPCTVALRTIFHNNEVLSTYADDIAVSLAIAVLDSMMDYVSCNHIKGFKYCSHSKIIVFATVWH